MLGFQISKEQKAVGHAFLSTVSGNSTSHPLSLEFRFFSVEKQEENGSKRRKMAEGGREGGGGRRKKEKMVVGEGEEWKNERMRW